MVKMQEPKRKKLRFSRVLLTMGAIVITLSGADTLRRSLASQQPLNLTINGNFRNAETPTEAPTGSSLSLGTTDESTTAFEGVKYLGYSEYELSKNELAEGVLAIYTESAPAEEDYSRAMVDLSDEKNEFYTLVDEKVELNEDAAEALNSMMEDYANQTALADFIVYGTTDTYTDEDSYCPKAFSESKAGYCVDLALNAYGSVMTYDGYDTEGWIGENCWKYGFIVRYPQNKKDKTGKEYCPWHLRYVGEIHAAIMEKKQMCLEEYVDFLKQYTFDEPYSLTFNDKGYQIYSVTGNDEKYKTRVPISGNYEITGDNKDAFIITALKNE